jgi:hypothetical protein
MRQYRILTGLVMGLVLILLSGQLASAQSSLLRKLKQRAEDEIVNDVFGDKKKDENPTYQQTRSNSGSKKTRGGGLTNTAPDVAENISTAESAFKQGSYTEARYAVRQAILGIEMEIGQNILDGFPETVKGLNTVPENDNVASMSIGFVGLVIERVYRKNDQQLNITVGNDAAMLSAVNMYLTSGAYTSTGDDQTHKQVKFKDYRGVLAYDDYSGYTLSVPFGQSSIFVAEGVNFENEQEIMDAANEFDIEKIKKEFGEQ